MMDRMLLCQARLLTIRVLSAQPEVRKTVTLRHVVLDIPHFKEQAELRVVEAVQPAIQSTGTISLHGMQCAQVDGLVQG